MHDKKYKIGQMSFETVMVWILIMMVGIALLMLVKVSSDSGLSAWETIKKIFPFI
jgi:hypothetical protein